MPETRWAAVDPGTHDMALVTLDGHIGAGAPEVGRRIARMFDFTYVDRLLLPGHVRAPSTATGADEPPPRFSDRIWAAVERAINGFALGNAAGDPYFSMSEPDFFPLTWDVSPSGPRVKAAEIDAADPAELAETRLRALAEQGKAVLVHRAGCLEARDAPASLRIGLFAPWEDRVRRIMAREGINRLAVAERVIRERQEAQVDYFGRFHGAHPDDESLYDICIDTGSEHIDASARRVAREVRSMLSGQPAADGSPA